jgi:hypothetical protein
MIETPVFPAGIRLAQGADAQGYAGDDVPVQGPGGLSGTMNTEIPLPWQNPRREWPGILPRHPESR